MTGPSVSWEKPRGHAPCSIHSQDPHPRACCVGIRYRRSSAINLGQHKGAADGVIFRPLNGKWGIMASDAVNDRARRCDAGGNDGLFRHRHCGVGVDHDNPHYTNPRPASDPFRARRLCMIVTDRITRMTSDSEKIVVSVPSA